ncbi:MAG: Spy/CpxP family protein refolding chaperone [Leptolyngbyaceae cyanobacterium bins.59]|nr:Spy/CpxP family protein refolding chaperone [Leptolyngbyaceae cyanobacterium bins.59]
MKIKNLFLLPGTLALLLAATPIIPAFTDVALAGPGKMGGRGERIYQQLNLTDAQKTQMQQIRESAKQQMDAVLTSEQKAQLQQARQNRQRPNLNLTEEQKARMKAIGEETRSKMDAVLTDQQRQQLQTLKQQRQQNRQNRQNAPQ